jgi:hypothetical protein
VLRAGLAVGIVMLLTAAALGFVNPLLVPCIALFAGALAGFWAASADRPASASLATRSGAGAGFLAGVGALLGQFFTAIAAISGLGPHGAAALIQQFGFTVDISSPFAFYTAALVFSVCTGLISLVLMALSGSLGGLLWHGLAGRPRQPA